jgi:glucan phosphoethanolaminetransferase (alkaline phosphatase superfamily)
MKRILLLLAKLLSSVMAIAGSLGLLWQGSGELVLWPGAAPGFAPMPDWIVHLASGWYPEFLNDLGKLYQNSAWKAAAYGVVCALTVLMVFAIPLLTNPWTRGALSVLVASGVFYELAMYDIGGQLPSVNETATVLANIGFGFDGTLDAYSTEIWRNGIWAAALLVIFMLPSPVSRRAGRIAGATVVGALTGVASVLVWTSGYTTFFPSPVKPYLDAYRAIHRAAALPLAPVAYGPHPVSAFEKIVFIVDESVRGDYLSLNSPGIGTTPFLVSMSAMIDNYGIASAMANCSYQSRTALRHGLRERDLGPDWQNQLSRTTLWQYARHAGFNTVYVDTFGSPVALVNGMTVEEKTYIDNRILIDGPQYERDMSVVDAIKALLNDPTPMFIFVEKYGVHIPYDRMYPSEENIFGADLSSPFSLESQAEFVKHYKNAIHWSVDVFFSRLLKGNLPAGTLVIYTADHGQSLLAGKRSHCSEGASATRGEAAVPLFAMTSDRDWAARLGGWSHRNRDKVSQSAIAPTLLLAMGYDKSWVADHFDASLLDPWPDTPDRRFLAIGRTRHFDSR